MNRSDTMRGSAGGTRDTDELPGAPFGTRLDERQKQEFADGHNAFALALYRRLFSGTGNRVCSPVSIRATMAMAWAGARGRTAAQMADALRFGQTDERIDAGFAALHRRLGQLRKSGGGTTMANSLWVQAGAPLGPEFVKRMDHTFDARATAADFRGDPEGARRAINEWSGRETAGEIRELLGEGALDVRTRLVLANACKFSGSWEKPFPAERTTDQPFHLAGGGEVHVPLMFLDSLVGVSQGDDFTAIDLAYRGNGMSMLVLLPRATNGLPALEARLTTDLLAGCLARMMPLPAKVWLPRFRMRWSGDLEAALGGMGMTDAFDPDRADFSGINGRRPPDDDALAISRVRHEACVETDEQGTRASAATAAAMWMCGPVEFRADHPFLFAVRGVRYGTIWYLGRVGDPSRSD